PVSETRQHCTNRARCAFNSCGRCKPFKARVRAALVSIGGGMIRWRRKTDGFEWHKHVRTTIRIRREHRRQRIEEARLLALEGMKEAGRAGVAVGSSWLSFVDRLVRSAAYSLQSGVRRL